jgi:hypothetical protein
MHEGIEPGYCGVKVALRKVCKDESAQIYGGKSEYMSTPETPSDPKNVAHDITIPQHLTNSCSLFVQPR